MIVMKTSSGYLETQKRTKEDLGVEKASPLTKKKVPPRDDRKGGSRNTKCSAKKNRSRPKNHQRTDKNATERGRARMRKPGRGEQENASHVKEWPAEKRKKKKKQPIRPRQSLTSRISCGKSRGEGNAYISPSQKRVGHHT